MQISPSFIVTLDSMIKAEITGNWQRAAPRAKEIGRIMKVRPSGTRRELITWILDTIGIYPQGQGGNRRYDDMASINYEIDNLNVGAGLQLTTNELEDNQLKNNPEIGALDYAAKWSRDRGMEGALYPRSVLFGGGGVTGLIPAGTTALCYDGQPFFSTSHPINPVGKSGGTFSNIITGVGLNTQPTGTAPLATYMDALIQNMFNLQTAVSTIAKLSFSNGYNSRKRFLRPNLIVAPTALELVINQLIGGGGFLTSGPAADIISQTSNVFKNYSFGEPIFAPELDDLSPTTYYIGCEELVSDPVGAFIFSEREAFKMIGYPDVHSAATNRSKMWEWDYDGRNVGAYGHPYLFFQCTV
jgi:phage major head subunit gpT-like protein